MRSDRSGRSGRWVVRQVSQVRQMGGQTGQAGQAGHWQVGRQAVEEDDVDRPGGQKSQFLLPPWNKQYW